MGNTTISMAIFNSYVSLPEGTNNTIKGCLENVNEQLRIPHQLKHAGRITRW